MIAGAASAQAPALQPLNGGNPIVHAHNCYPYDGRWSDRVDRALASGFPVAIEQDIAARADTATRGVIPILSHDPKTNGTEPTLRAYFFERVRPLVEAELKRNDRSRWPFLILHFDFKINDPALLRAVWNLLGEYESWITTAPKTPDPHVVAPLAIKPVLVLTEDSDAQEQVFYQSVPAGGNLRVFGSAHTKSIEGDRETRIHLAATVPPERLLTEPATNYRRWWNNSWYEVEEGGQKRAGSWTSAEETRLRALVDHAHRLGYWIRFYTLDGFKPADDRGWDDSYNFGSLEAVRLRWDAARKAGVDLIATDQYEDLAAFLRGSASEPRR